ncbi:MAG TPA: TIGR04282 family arsenosugar biosynthesis glycosyltransferase [Methylomirabilota bacterium]
MLGGRALDAAVGLALMAKAPRPGTVKTRLCPPLRAAEAAELARCFLLDAIERIVTVADVRPIVAYAPRESRAEMEAMAPGLTLVPQRGEDLGERQAALVDDLLARGHRAALLIGADSPTLPPETIDEAVSLIMAPDVDVVVGPTEDGGYYLIGLRAPCRPLFETMPWSTPAVLSLTLLRARRLGLRAVCLPTWYDVDTGEDLARLESALRDLSGARPRHTREFLARRRLPGTVPSRSAHHGPSALDGGRRAPSRVQ